MNHYNCPERADLLLFSILGSGSPAIWLIWSNKKKTGSGSNPEVGRTQFFVPNGCAFMVRKPFGYQLYSIQDTGSW